MGTYVERYVYDAVGNFLQMQHRGSDPAHAGWTRAYDYLEASLIEDGSGSTPLKTSNRLSRTTLNPNGANPPQAEPYQHDAHGNMVRMPHLGGGLPGPNMHWDYKDQLRQIDLGGGGAAFYVYDASGQRVRKVWEKIAGPHRRAPLPRRLRDLPQARRPDRREHRHAGARDAARDGRQAAHRPGGGRRIA